MTIDSTHETGGQARQAQESEPARADDGRRAEIGNETTHSDEPAQQHGLLGHARHTLEDAMKRLSERLPRPGRKA